MVITHNKRANIRRWWKKSRCGSCNWETSGGLNEKHRTTSNFSKIRWSGVIWPRTTNLNKLFELHLWITSLRCNEKRKEEAYSCYHVGGCCLREKLLHKFKTVALCFCHNPGFAFIAFKYQPESIDAPFKDTSAKVKVSWIILFCAWFYILTTFRTIWNLVVVVSVAACR